MLLERFGDREVFERMEGALGATHTHREVMEAEMATITTPLEEAVAFLVAAVEIRAGFRRVVERFRPLVLSSSFHETIEPVLAREGVEVELVANRIDARPDGWRVLWADDAPCPECGELCKRRALPRGRRRRRRAARRRDPARGREAPRARVRPASVLRLGSGPAGPRRARAAARRLPAAARARPVRVARHLDHRATGVALRGLRDQNAD